MKPFLSVIVPAYNEEKNFKSGKIEALYSYLKKRPYSTELIFSDDGSSDGTLLILEEFKKNKPEVSIIKNPHKGKGPTVAAGMVHAKGENRLFTDFDQATKISEIEKLLPFRNKGYDVVIGSREVKGSHRKKEPFYRHLMGKGFNLVVRLFAIKGIHDTQCGFKLFSKEATEALFPRLHSFKSKKTISDAFTGAFDVEILYLANKLGYKIAEVPVAWRHYKTERINPLKDSLRMFNEVIKIRLNDMLGKYNISES